MNADEFLKFTSAESDEHNVLYVLGHRKVDNKIEYLVRYNSPTIEYDVWEKSTSLTCYTKIIEHWQGNVPEDIKPNLRPEDRGEKDKLQSDDGDDSFKIHGVEKINDVIYLRVHIPGTPGTLLKKPDEIPSNYSEQLVLFYEQQNKTRAI